MSNLGFFIAMGIGAAWATWRQPTWEQYALFMVGALIGFLCAELWRKLFTSQPQ